MARIFISYKRVDKDKVFKIKDRIESALGEKCWIDLDGIESDAIFKQVIIQAINECEIVLFMYSKAHCRIENFEKDWTVRELNYAAIKDKRIVFINLDGSKLADEFIFDYGMKQQVDAYSEESIKHLCTDLKKWEGNTKTNFSNNKTLFEEENTLNSYFDKFKKKCLNKRYIIPAALGIILGLSLTIGYIFLREDDNSLTIDNITYKMVKVEGGTFIMGSGQEAEDRYGLEKPAHQVTLSSFCIGETEVTQALWKAVMGDNPSYTLGDNLPVDSVSYIQCQSFIEQLNIKTGKKFRLPTEAEWEFAARGGNKSNNTLYSGSNNLDDVGWYYSDGTQLELHPVATKKPNELGIYDMSGNVWEWCSDWCENYSDSTVTDPQGPVTGTWRANRGGAYYISEYSCRPAFRGRFEPNVRIKGLGFRLVISE